MRARRTALGCSIAALLLGTAAEGQLVPFEERVFHEQLLRPTGQPVVPLYDGWFENPDGTYGICFGYFNLNTEEAIDVPHGPDNFIVPERFQGLQPTHFDPVPAAGYRRHFCVFTVTVPEDFGEGRVVWTLRTNAEPLSTPGKVIAPYVLDEPDAHARGVTAPILKLDPTGPQFRGRLGHTAQRRTVRVGEPLDLTVWVTHPAPRTWVGWTQHRGPGEVRFNQAETTVGIALGAARTTATFSEPGEYLLRVQSIDTTASFEYHCCWTNGYVPVTVTR